MDSRSKEALASARDAAERIVTLLERLHVQAARLAAKLAEIDATLDQTPGPGNQP